MTREEITAFILDALKRKAQEAEGIEQARHDHDFSALVKTLADDLTTLAARFVTLVDTYYQEQPGLYIFYVWLEEADGTLPKKQLGTIKADTSAQAIERAAQLWEIPGHDLVVSQFFTHPPIDHMPVAANYKPQEGDIYIYKLWFDQYATKQFDGQHWQFFKNDITDATIIEYIESLNAQYLGDDPKIQRMYYRPRPPAEQQ